MIILNDYKVEFNKFPNGETNVDKNTILVMPYNNIIFKYEDDSDLIKLMLIKRHLDEQFIKACNLTILYMPYSRQDRTEGKSVFTLKYVCEFINSLHFAIVNIDEPHSDVTPALLDRCVIEYPTTILLNEAILESGFDRGKDYIFYPDAGAQKRYSSKNPGFKEIVGFKKRNFQTGKIESLQVVGAENLCNSNVIIVDDLCSKGGTFMLSAKKLKEIGAAKIYLVVTHCEETILEGDVLNSPLIEKVFTTGSIITDPHMSKLSVIRSYAI